MSDPVPMDESVRDLIQAMTGVTLPEPCPRCGWQYDDDVLVKAARREVTLDPQPTHLCQPRRFGTPCSDRCTHPR